MDRPAERRAAPQRVRDVGARAARDQQLHQLEVLVDRRLMQRQAVRVHRQEGVGIGAGVERHPRGFESGRLITASPSARWISSRGASASKAGKPSTLAERGRDRRGHRQAGASSALHRLELAMREGHVDRAAARRWRRP